MAGMRIAARGRVLALLTAVSYALAFVQRPGDVVSETRVELSAEPALFLERVFNLWSGTTDLGHVQSGQFNGYLFPMGPWFAGGDALGVPMWVVQRLWLGTLLALAAWGVVRLLDELLPRRPLAQLGAGLLFVLNPYVVQFASRGTVFLIAYAALPWLMVAAHRGARRPRGWRWPAVVALVLAASGGGVNAASIAFMLLGPAGLLAYDVFTRVLPLRDAWGFTWRAGLLGALASAWWALPVLLQSRYGADFLSFTEQPGTIWATTSLSESLRQLGFWGLYVPVGFHDLEPFLDVGRYYLFEVPVIVGSFAVPLLAFAGVWIARRWRYAAFFALLAVVTMLVMAAGWPEGAPLRRALNFAYEQIAAGRFLRTTYKAEPLLALAFACLGGAAVAVLAERLERRRWLLAPLVLVPVLAAAPLVAGRAIDAEQAYDVPAAWPDALADATAAAGPAGRTMIFPGELFGWYRWGGTMDPIGPPLERRPVAIREVVPYADQRSAQLQTVVDDLVQQDRLTPGQLPPLLRLMGVAQVVVATDSERRRSGALDPVEAAIALGREPALRRPARSYGETLRYHPAAQRSGPVLPLPQLRRYDLPDPGATVRVEPAAEATVLEGDADGITALAGVGGLDPNRALLYAADLDRDELRSVLGGGARIVLTDSARRRAIVASRTRANRGPALPVTAPIPSGQTRYAPFGAGGSDDETVAAYDTLAHLYAPALPAFSQFPEHRAYAAFDGRRDTTWLADPILPPEDRYLEAELREPLAVEAITVFPHSDRVGSTTRVEVSFDGGDARELAVSERGTQVRVPGGELRSLRVRIADTDRAGGDPAPGGIDEIRVAGLRVNEWLRLPRALAAAARGVDLSRNPVDVVLERTTADFPRRAGRAVGPPQRRSPLDAVDPEAGIERQLELPEARQFTASGWASVSPHADDDAIDRLVGMPRRWRMTSSSRFEGVPGRRASSAFDGDSGTAWAGDRRRAWIAVRAPRPVELRRFVLRPGDDDYARPQEVRVQGTGHRAQGTVRPDGMVVLDRPVRGRDIRIEIVRATRARLRAVAIAEIEAPGLRPPAPRRSGNFRTECGNLAVASVDERSPLYVRGSVRDLDDGASLRLANCGGPLDLPDGASLIGARPGELMRPDRLLLRSPAPDPVVTTALAPGRVVSVSGEGPVGVPERAQLDLQEPSWLVFGQSYSPGWRAECRDARGGKLDLGAPVPIDGFANGWRVDPGCVEAVFSFPPQRLAVAAYAVSGLAFLLLLALALAGWWRERGEAFAEPGPAPSGDAVVRPGLRRALIAAAAIGAVGGFLFALRAGAVLAPLAFLALYRGVTVRTLLALAAVAVALLPLIYVVFTPDNPGGYSFDYAADLIGAHWVATFAVACMAAAAGLMAWRVRGSDLGRADHAVPREQLAQERDPRDE